MRATAAVGAHAVSRLRLLDFRNYPALELEPPPGLLLFHGDNGAGKTNLLEAVSLLTAGRGLRHARSHDLDRRDGGPWRVEAEALGADGPLAITTRRHPDTERRTVRLDHGPERSPNLLADRLAMVWLTPAMDRLFVEGSAGRRRFLDRLVLAPQPGHAASVGLYERSLRERALLLRQGRADPAWLGALERRAAEAGVAVAAARRELIGDLGRMLEAEPGPFPKPRLEITDQVDAWLLELPALEAEQRLAQALRQSRPLDAATGGAATGPHRADLLASDATSGEPVTSCSTGRQKALLVSTLLALAELRLRRHGDLPILLLDEVAAHLDRSRREALLERLLSLGAQCWLTGTDRALFDPLRGRARFIHVHQATLDCHD